jgi:hypothetical protein
VFGAPKAFLKATQMAALLHTTLDHPNVKIEKKVAYCQIFALSPPI